VVAGTPFPGWEDACAACVRAHAGLLRDVPLVGWDVAVVDGDGSWSGNGNGSGGGETRTMKNRPLLLEANLSLNFFGDAVARAPYASFLVDFFNALAEREEAALGAAVT
jgi:hypothetical protein